MGWLLKSLGTTQVPTEKVDGPRKYSLSGRAARRFDSGLALLAALEGVGSVVFGLDRKSVV